MIHVLTDPATGGTFLSWTLHYLAGHTEYFLLSSNQHTSLTSNPINSINAHKFRPNQANINFNKQQFIEFAEKLHNQPTKGFHVLYFHQFENKETTYKAVDYTNKNATKLFVVDTSNINLYHCSSRKRSWVRNSDGTFITNNAEIQERFINLFFKDSKEVWNSLGLTNIWDLREFIALNFRPFNRDHIYDYVDKTRDHYVLNGNELWTSLNFGIKNLFDYIDINIDQRRLENWQNVYSRWKQLHYQRFMFAMYFDSIIEGVLNNYNIDLVKFDLDIEQEAAIQHVLIYKHNLNLKTWQLEKFVNTKQLYNLLEPNIHSLSS